MIDGYFHLAGRAFGAVEQPTFTTEQPSIFTNVHPGEIVLMIVGSVLTIALIIGFAFLLRMAHRDEQKLKAQEDQENQ